MCTWWILLQAIFSIMYVHLVMYIPHIQFNILITHFIPKLQSWFGQLLPIRLHHCQCCYLPNISLNLLNQACTAVHLVSWNHFLFAHRYVCVGVYVCLSVCLCALKDINNQWHDMVWYIDLVWLVKPVLQLCRILPSINWKGVALVTQWVMHTRQKCQSWHCTSHRRRHINYLTVVTRWSASVIKLSGWMCSNKFN